ncbi:hypothetical protein B0T10DRAFT_199687 [Thelonectria olida]|uniref:Uncharacterized protein n=1 Tax=Thelonectria olida TaxID=1576542 RepID=A0A9P8VVW1_9HYPO|nr:hypothetical protein B0T10DRAFT_199687 [Thelonectria olida]
MKTSLTAIVLCALAGGGSGLRAPAPECAVDCSRSLMDQHGLLEMLALCNDIALQRALFLCLTNSCHATSYGPALAYTISKCSNLGASIANLHPVEFHHVQVAQQKPLSLKSRAGVEAQGATGGLTLAMDCTAGLDGVLTLSLPPAGASPTGLPVAQGASPDKGFPNGNSGLNASPGSPPSAASLPVGSQPLSQDPSGLSSSPQGAQGPNNGFLPQGMGSGSDAAFQGMGPGNGASSQGTGAGMGSPFQGMGPSNGAYSQDSGAGVRNPADEDYGPGTTSPLVPSGDQPQVPQQPSPPNSPAPAGTVNYGSHQSLPAAQNQAPGSPGPPTPPPMLPSSTGPNNPVCPDGSAGGCSDQGLGASSSSPPSPPLSPGGLNGDDSCPHGSNDELCGSGLLPPSLPAAQPPPGPQSPLGPQPSSGSQPLSGPQSSPGPQSPLGPQYPAVPQSPPASAPSDDSPYCIYDGSCAGQSSPQGPQYVPQPPSTGSLSPLAPAPAPPQPLPLGVCSQGGNGDGNGDGNSQGDGQPCPVQGPGGISPDATASSGSPAPPNGLNGNPGTGPNGLPSSSQSPGASPYGQPSSGRVGSPSNLNGAGPVSPSVPLPNGAPNSQSNNGATGSGDEDCDESNVKRSTTEPETGRNQRVQPNRAGVERLPTEPTLAFVQASADAAKTRGKRFLQTGISSRGQELKPLLVSAPAHVARIRDKRL